MISKNLNVVIQEFEWSTKSLDNIVCAIMRHLSAKMRPDPDCVKEFGEMTGNFFDTLLSRILTDNPEPQTYLMDYPKGQESWSDSKKLRYEKNLMRVFWDAGYTDYLCSFILMVKSGEVNTTPSMEYD